MSHKLIARQLMFDDKHNEIIEEPVSFWATLDEVPNHIKEFILNIVTSRAIYDSNTNQYHCAICLKELDEEYFCSNCSKKFIIPANKNSKYIVYENISNIRHLHDTSHYFVFDIVDGEVLIYIFYVHTNYFNSMMTMPYQLNKMTLEHVYLVKEDGLTNLLTNEFFSYNEYDRYVNSDDFSDTLFNVFEMPMSNNFLYPDTFELLKNIPMYQYSNIWTLKKYYENKEFTLASLTYYPIYCKQFEYLVKMKLYSLAINSPYLINYKNNFKESFGVDKKYYQFMKDIDIDINGLEALRLYPTTDKEIIDFIASDIYLFQELSEYVDIGKLKEYFEKQNLNYHQISEYYDYIRCCEHMELNLKDKHILFPKHFIEEHDRITALMVIATDPEINKRISSLSSILTLNIYEDDDYIIFPASSIESLIDESSQMSNCVRNYCDKVSNNECQIYFMRYKDNVNKSLVTVEVRNGKVVQARTKFNETPSEEIMRLLKKWEKEIILIENGDS